MFSATDWFVNFLIKTAPHCPWNDGSFKVAKTAGAIRIAMVARSFRGEVFTVFESPASKNPKRRENYITGENSGDRGNKKNFRGRRLKKKKIKEGFWR